MNVRHLAANETWAWIAGDRKGTAPCPPDGMHPLAVAEWWLGYNDAHEHEAREERVLDRWTSTTMWIIKCAVIIGACAFAKWAGNPYLMVAVGVAGLIYLWRTK